MRAADFIAMADQDIQTHADKARLAAVVELMRDVLASLPDADIDGEKNAQGLFDAMKKQAEKNKSGMCYCVTPAEARALAAEYLGVAVVGDNGAAVKSRATGAIGAVNLEDFF
jgi:hypothetical protein